MNGIQKLSRAFSSQSHRGLVKGQEGIICTILKEIFFKVYDNDSMWLVKIMITGHSKTYWVVLNKLLENISKKYFKYIFVL